MSLLWLVPTRWNVEEGKLEKGRNMFSKKVEVKGKKKSRKEKIKDQQYWQKSVKKKKKIKKNVWEKDGKSQNINQIRYWQYQTWCLSSTKGRIIFCEEGGGSEGFIGGPHFFPNLKRGGGGHVFFQSSILNIFFKKGMPLSEIRVQADLQRFCLIHKPTV